MPMRAVNAPDAASSERPAARAGMAAMTVRRSMGFVGLAFERRVRSSRGHLHYQLRTRA